MMSCPWPYRVAAARTCVRAPGSFYCWSITRLPPCPKPGPAQPRFLTCRSHILRACAARARQHVFFAANRYIGDLRLADFSQTRKTNSLPRDFGMNSADPRPILPNSTAARPVSTPAMHSVAIGFNFVRATNDRVRRDSNPLDISRRIRPGIAIVDEEKIHARFPNLAPFDGDSAAIPRVAVELLAVDFALAPREFPFPILPSAHPPPRIRFLVPRAKKVKKASLAKPSVPIDSAPAGHESRATPMNRAAAVKISAETSRLGSFSNSNCAMRAKQPACLPFSKIL